MTRKEQVSYLRIALSLQKIIVDDEIADRIIETYEKVLQLKGKFSVSDAVDIQMKMDRNYTKEKLQA